MLAQALGFMCTVIHTRMYTQNMPVQYQLWATWWQMLIETFTGSTSLFNLELDLRSVCVLPAFAWVICRYSGTPQPKNMDVHGYQLWLLCFQSSIFCDLRPSVTEQQPAKTAVFLPRLKGHNSSLPTNIHQKQTSNSSVWSTIHSLVLSLRQ